VDDSFEIENYLYAAKILTKDDYSMIDWIINNGSQEIRPLMPNILKRLEVF